MLTETQIEVFESLKKYCDFPKKELNKFPSLSHLKNPAERYKYFCEARNKGEKVCLYKTSGMKEAIKFNVDIIIA
jgi:hypothetical protein